MIPLQHIHYDKNVGGVNFGQIESALEIFELANGHNFDIRPRGGYSKRDGTSEFIANDYNHYEPGETTIDEIIPGWGFPGNIFYWTRPDSSRHLVWFSMDPSTYSIGLVRPHTEVDYGGGDTVFKAFEKVRRGTYLGGDL